MSGPHQTLAVMQKDPGFPISQPKVSLIVATCNRVDELERLLCSLDRQSYKNVEVVIVDQNPDDRLVPVLQEHSQLIIRHLRSVVGASIARNAGLRVAEGAIVAFPDDDCWYPDHLLADVVKWFGQHPDLDGLFTVVRNENGKPMTPKFPPRQGPCTRKTVLRCAMAANAFLRSRAASAAGLFREDIGPGTSSPYQSGEDLDYLIRPLERGMRLAYEPQFTVYHPELNSGERLRRTAYSYALGVGNVWRLHSYPWWWCLGEIVFRSMGGSAFQLCKGDPQRSYIYLLRATGQLRGYLSRSAELHAGRNVNPIADDHA